MTHTAEISRTNPTCILILIDQSGSMEDYFGSPTSLQRKSEAVAESINKLLQQLVLRSAKKDGIRDYFYIGIIGYGKIVGSPLLGVLANKDILPISEIGNNPSRIEERKIKVTNGAGELVTQNVKFPVWIEPMADGPSPLLSAFTCAEKILVKWLKDHPDCYPPIVIHISDGEPTDGDVQDVAHNIMNLTSTDGNVLLFNIYLTTENEQNLIFPDNDAQLLSSTAKLLYQISSTLPDNLRVSLENQGYLLSSDARGFAINTDFELLITSIEIGTRYIYLNQGTRLVVEIVNEDIIPFKSDVIVLKHAQDFYGVDKEVIALLPKGSIDKIKSSQDKYTIINTEQNIGAKYALFIHVSKLEYFGYTQIHDFMKLAFEIIYQKLPNSRHISMTIHGVGYGLDVVESFFSQLSGLYDSIPEHINTTFKISIVEKNYNMAKYLSELLSRFQIKDYNLLSNKNRLFIPPSIELDKTFKSEYKYEIKPRIFVAMPFTKELEDVYYYGIQNSVRKNGYICERIDKIAFTGDILDHIKKGINKADIVIADLTGANPNVYLEIGYAWGKNKPTILLARKKSDLKFDVRGQKCIIYDTIIQLEYKLDIELKNISSSYNRY